MASTSSPYHYIRSVQTSFTTTHRRAASISSPSDARYSPYLQSYASPSSSSNPSRRRASSVLAPIEENCRQLPPIGSGRKRLPSTSAKRSDLFTYDCPSYSWSRNGQLSLLVTSTPSRHNYAIHVPPPPTSTLLPPVSTPALSPPTKVDSSRDARSKLVAGILLHRVYAVGRPMRFGRRALDRGKREYVKSGLSSVVCAAA